MAELAILLDAALRAARVPILGVTIGDVQDRRTWLVNYAKDATLSQRATGDALVAAFNPNDPATKDAATTAEATRAAADPLLKAASRYLFYAMNGDEAVFDDKAIEAARARWERCFKEAAS